MPLLLHSEPGVTVADLPYGGGAWRAATSIGVGVTSAPTGLRVNRPFVLVIRERLSGAILFIGRIMNPATG